jgi:transcriptional regulatory protein GAL4
MDTTIYSYVATQSAYHLTTIRIYNRLISNPPPSAAELINLDDELIGGWRTRLPRYFCDENLPLSPEHLLGHSISRWRFRVMRIVMYRPFFLKWAQEGLGSIRSPGSQFGKGATSASASEDEAVRRCFQASEECISIIYNFWTTATHTRLAAWYVLYFLLQAALIPVHCLRKHPTHPSAGSWIGQVRSALDVINALTLNPSAQKCRDIIFRLCGESLNDGSRGSNQYSAELSQADSYPYEMPPTDQKDMNIDSWMTEIDTAIDGYDSYVRSPQSIMACDEEQSPLLLSQLPRILPDPLLFETGDLVFGSSARACSPCFLSCASG